MTTPLEIVRVPGPLGRYYVHPTTGEKLPGVTSVLSILAKPNLVRWQISGARKDGAMRALRWAERHPLTAPPEAATVTAALRASRASPEDTTARDMGTLIHALAEDRLRSGQWPDKPPDGEAFAFAVQLRNAVDALRPEPMLSEATVWNARDGYAGTLDAVVRIEGRPVLLDLKTGRTGVHAEMSLQLAAYRYGIQLLDGSRLPATDRAAILWVRPDTWQLIDVPAGPDEYRLFLATLQLFRWRVETERKATGA